MWLNRSNASSEEMFQPGLLRQAVSTDRRMGFKMGVCGANTLVGQFVSRGCSTIRFRRESASIDWKVDFLRDCGCFATRGARGELGHSGSFSVSISVSGESEIVGSVLMTVGEDGEEYEEMDLDSSSGTKNSSDEERDGVGVKEVGEGCCRDLTGLTLVTVGDNRVLRSQHPTTSSHIHSPSELASFELSLCNDDVLRSPRRSNPKHRRSASSTQSIRSSLKFSSWW